MKHHTLARRTGFLALAAGAGAFLLSAGMAGFNAFALSAPVLENLNNASLPTWGATPETSIGTIVASIILAILGLLGVLFVILLTYGGFLWITSAGEEDKVKKATGLILNAAVGALIVIAAYALTYYILTKLSAAVGG